jgi:hypothetical protein
MQEEDEDDLQEVCSEPTTTHEKLLPLLHVENVLG